MKFLNLLYLPNKDTRYPFLFLLFVALLALLGAVYAYFMGEATAMPWQTVPEIQTISMPADRFSVLLQDFDIRVKGFVLSERFQADYPHANIPATFFILIFTGIALAYFVALVSTMRQLPFFAGMLLLMLFISTFNFDLLGIFESANQYILMGSLVVLGGTAFGLQAFFTHINFRGRLFLFLILIAVLGFYLFQASPLSPAHTALHLAHYSAPAVMVAAVFFIIWVAYENIHGLLWFNTQAHNPEKRFSLWQFALISCLYLANLLLLYLMNAGIIRVDIILLNPFLIALISGLVGFWGTKRREVHYSRFFSFEDRAALLYLVFAILAFSSVGYAFATVNDSLIRSYRDIIVYTHLAFGALFFIYTLVNFGQLIAQKLRVYRVVYDPKVIPFYTVYFLSIILLVALSLRTNFTTYRKAKAGYYNYIGDYYKETKDDLLAERFYHEAHVYDNNNMKATYSLAGLYADKSYLQAEINQLKAALLVHPNPKGYSRLANKYTDRENFFDQLFVLRAGLKKFPDNPQLLNNQALVYASTAMVDSAEYFFNLAQPQAEKPEIIQNNRLAFYLATAQADKAGEQVKALENTNYLALQSNLLFLQGFSSGKYVQGPISLPEEQALTPEVFANLYHAGLQGLAGSDKTVLARINKYLTQEVNAPYHFDLSLLKAFIQNRLGQTLAARTTLENLAATEPEYSGYLLDMIGLQLMQQKLYGAAADHFAKARTKGWPEAGLHRAFALAFLPDKQVDALLEANQIASSESPDLAQLANGLQYLLQANPNQIISHASDSVKVQYLQLNQVTGGLDVQEFLAIGSTIKNPELKKVSQLGLASFYVKSGNLSGASQVLEALVPQLTEQNALLSSVNILQAEVLLQTNNLKQLQTAIPRLYLTGNDAKLKYYYEAVLAEKQNQTGKAAKLYARALEVLPYHERTVLAAADFYSNKLKQPNKAYDLLLNSITYNPYSPAVYKAYILKSVETGLAGFAETALEELAGLISPSEYQEFQQQFNAALARREASMQLR